jgi:hypothetical protein
MLPTQASRPTQQAEFLQDARPRGIDGARDALWRPIPLRDVFP